MMPFMPPPPRCAARPFQAAGSTTRKLIGRAVASGLTGAMTPSTRQCAGVLLTASTHAGARRVTLRTGSPIEATGMKLPRRIAEHSAGVIVLLDGGCALAVLAARSEI